MVTGDSVQMVALEGSLQFNAPRPENEGVYQCRAMNAHGTALTQEMHLREARMSS